MPMHCPHCLTEYRDGFVQCADCGAPLASGPPPEQAPRQPDAQDHEVELVTVFETYDSFLLRWAKCSLDEAGIPCIVNGGAIFHEDAMPPFPGGLLGAYGCFHPLTTRPFEIQVESDLREQAEDLLEPLRRQEGG